jgi:sporulation protein YlmC with PRC-barrel domain
MNERRACGNLLGAPVVDSAGGEIGTLAHLVLDLVEARIAFALVAHGGVLGLGERLCAFSWSQLTFDAARDCFVADSQRVALPDPRPAPAHLPVDL